MRILIKMKYFLFIFSVLIAYSCNVKGNANDPSQNVNQVNGETIDYDTITTENIPFINEVVKLPSVFYTPTCLDKSIYKNKEKWVNLNSTQVDKIFKEYRPDPSSIINLVFLKTIDKSVILGFNIEGLAEDTILVMSCDQIGKINDELYITDIYREDYITSIDGKELIYVYENKLTFNDRNMTHIQTEKEFYFNTTDTTFEQSTIRNYSIIENNGHFNLLDEKEVLKGEPFKF